MQPGAGTLLAPSLMEKKMLDQSAVVNAYVSDKTQTVKTIAETFGIKPADVAAILRLNNITVRRGAPGGISEDARAKARATQKSKAFYRIINNLLDEHSEQEIIEAVTVLALSREVEPTQETAGTHAE